MGRRRGCSVGAIVIGAAAGYAAGKLTEYAVKKAETPNLKLPEGKDQGFKEVHDKQDGNGASIAISIFLALLWFLPTFFGFQLVTGGIYDQRMDQLHNGWTLILITNAIAVGIWAARRAYANTRMINAIYAYMKYATDNLEFLEFKFLREVPEPSRKALEDWNTKLEEYRKKLDAPTSDDTYFPNMDNLTFKEMETVYYSFTNPEKENLRNFWAWVATRSEEERQRVLKQMEERINREKIELYDEYASKKKGKR